MNFDDELFDGDGKFHLSRQQNRIKKQRYAKEKLKHPLEISEDELPAEVAGGGPHIECNLKNN